MVSEAYASKSKSKADVSWIDGKADFTSLSSLSKPGEENGSAVEQSIGEPAGQAAVSSQQSGYQTTKVANPQPYTLQSGWDSLLSSTGLKGITDVTGNLGYVLTQLPDLLVGLFTGKRTANLSENMLPIAAIMAGMFVKSPMLKALLIGIGGANLLNKAGHAALGMEGLTTDRPAVASKYPELRSGNAINAGKPVNYKVYPPEELNERITDPVLKGGCLIATIDRVPCTVQLPRTVIDAYHAGALPLNTLANAVLAKNDELRQTAARNYENDTPETLVRTRGIQ